MEDEEVFLFLCIVWGSSADPERGSTSMWEGKEADGENTIRHIARIQITISLGTAGGRDRLTSKLTHRGRRELDTYPPTLGTYPPTPALKAVLVGTVYTCAHSLSRGVLGQRDRPSC